MISGFNMRRYLSFLPLFFFVSFHLSAYSPLPHGYGKIILGMSVAQVKQLLQENGEFGYHGDSDVSLLPGENRVLIETDAEGGHVVSFLDRCWFQFYDDKLYIITITMNRERIDHYSIFTTLCRKYGDPESLSPEKSVWQNEAVSMSLERPLSLKYIDLNIFNSLQSKSLVQESAREMTQQMFLEGL